MARGDPNLQLVIASNANGAGGARDPAASQERDDFHRALQLAWTATRLLRPLPSETNLADA